METIFKYIDDALIALKSLTFKDVIVILLLLASAAPLYVAFKYVNDEKFRNIITPTEKLIVTNTATCKIKDYYRGDSIEEIIIFYYKTRGTVLWGISAFYPFDLDDKGTAIICDELQKIGDRIILEEKRMELLQQQKTERGTLLQRQQEEREAELNKTLPDKK